MQAAVLTLYILFCLAYLFLLGSEKTVRLIKAIPAAILALYSLINGNLLFFLIFIFAGTGDYLLTFPGKLYLGALFFSLAYTTLNLLTFSHFSWVYLLAIVPYIVVLFLIKDELEGKKVLYPLAFYSIVVILFLVINAMGNIFHTGNLVLGFGLLLLAVSDMAIAVRFAMPSKIISIVIMATYYAGLILVSGFF